MGGKERVGGVVGRMLCRYAAEPSAFWWLGNHGRALRSPRRLRKSFYNQEASRPRLHAPPREKSQSLVRHSTEFSATAL